VEEERTCWYPKDGELCLSEKLVYGGDGLARADGRVVLTPFVLPAERVRVQAEREKPGLVRARPLLTSAFDVYARSQRVGGARRCALKVSCEIRPGATVGAVSGWCGVRGSSSVTLNIAK